MMDLVKYYTEFNRSVIRQKLRELKAYADGADRDALYAACKYITNDGAYERVRFENFKRFGTVLVTNKKQNDPVVDTIGDVVDEMYYPYAHPLAARSGEAEKWRLGIYPTIVTGICQSILNANTVMFTSFEQRFQFLSGEKSSNQVEQLITIQREQSGFQEKLIQSEFLSCGIGSAIVHIFPKGEWLSVDVVWPSAVYSVFGNMVSDETSNPARPLIKRGVDSSDLEDASAIIIHLGKAGARDSSPDKNLYIAYVGACDDFQYGRMVRWEAQNYWPIPEPGDNQILDDYERPDVGICNPMTFICKSPANKGVGRGYEYPIAVIKSDLRYGCNDPIPTTTDFVNNCIELEEDWSTILNQGMRHARGKDVFTLGNAAYKLPESLEVIVCKNGLLHNYVPGNAAGVMAGIDTATAVTRGVGAGRCVPQYLSIGPLSAQFPSGASLAIQTIPLIESRNRRIRMNTEHVEKLFYIESALLSEIMPDAMGMFRGVRQVWTPGSYQIPEDRSTMMSNLKTARDMELIDHVEAVRLANGLKTAEDAIALIKEMSARDPDYRGLEKREDKPVENQNPFGSDDAE